MTKQTNKERVQELIQQADAGLYTLFQPEKYSEYLGMMGRFHKFSLNNQILIYMQRPNATMVADYDKWQDRYGRNVMRGEKGIRIIAPTVVKKSAHAEQVNPVTNASGYGDTAAEKKGATYTTYKVATVFDVSQTDGKQMQSRIADNVNFDVFLEAAKRTSTVPVWFAQQPDRADVPYSRREQQIIIPEGMSKENMAYAMVRGIAQAKLDSQQPPVTDQATAEVPRTEEMQADSAAYAVCQYFGVESANGTDFSYITAWAWDKEPAELRSTLEAIRQVANNLINNIEKNYRVVCAERGIDLEEPAHKSEQASHEVAIQPPKLSERIFSPTAEQEPHPMNDSPHELSGELSDFAITAASLGIEILEHPGKGPQNAKTGAEEMDNGTRQQSALSKLHQYHQDGGTKAAIVPKKPELER